jgi:hypothetical protein
MAVEWQLMPETRDDLAEAYSWLARRVGLGEELFASVKACLDSIIGMPTMHEVVY